MLRIAQFVSSVGLLALLFLLARFAAPGQTQSHSGLGPTLHFAAAVR